MPAANQTTLEVPASIGAARSPVFQLSRQLAHDFNNIWSHIFGLTQQAKEMPSFQDCDKVLDRMSEVSARGLLYSRNVMGVLAHSEAEPQLLDACSAVREWVAENENILQDIITFSCLVPPYPLYVQLPPSTLRLILLSLVGYALRSGEGKRWAMLGVRKRTKEEAAEGVDVMLLCQPSDAHSSISYGLQQRIDAISSAVAMHGGSVQARMVAQVGVNVHIHLPLVPTPGDEVAEHRVR